MKKVLLAAMVLMLTAVSVSAKVNAGDKPTVEEKRQLTGFERIEQLGSLDVKYQQGTAFSVVVRAPQNIIKDVQTRVEGNKLIVSMKGQGRTFSFGKSSGDDVTVLVTSPDLIGVELNGSGDFECRKHLDTDQLDLSLRGSGDMKFHDVICDRISLSVVGSGNMGIRKLVSQQTHISLVGSGDMEVAQQQVLQTRITLKGSGDVKVNFSKCGSIEARLLGSGDITLAGDVKQFKHTKRGSGELDTSRLTVK